MRRGARQAGGNGSFDSDFKVLAVEHTVPLIVAVWLPDMTCYLLGVDEQRYRRLVAGYVPLATAWALALCTLGIAEAEQIPWRKAASVVVVADAISTVASGVVLVMR